MLTIVSHYFTKFVKAIIQGPTNLFPLTTDTVFSLRGLRQSQKYKTSKYKTPNAPIVNRNSRRIRLSALRLFFYCHRNGRRHLAAIRAMKPVGELQGQCVLTGL